VQKHARFMVQQHLFTLEQLARAASEAAAAQAEDAARTAQGEPRPAWQAASAAARVRSAQHCAARQHGGMQGHNHDQLALLTIGGCTMQVLQQLPQ
jgi:hypothetical protein